MRLLMARQQSAAKHVIATVFNIHHDNYDNMRLDLYKRLACTSDPQLLPQTATSLMSTMKLTIMNPTLI